MDDHREVLGLIRELSANQQSLNEGMAGVIDRITALEKLIEEHVKDKPEEVPAINDGQLYYAARALVVETGKCSTSFLQRILRIGYSRAASLADRLEENGVIGPYVGSRPREVLLSQEELEELEEKEIEAQERQWFVTEATGTDDEDDLYEEAEKIAKEIGQISQAYLQRKLRIGYSRSARLMDQLEKNGVITPVDSSIE